MIQHKPVSRDIPVQNARQRLPVAGVFQPKPQVPAARRDAQAQLIDSANAIGEHALAARPADRDLPHAAQARIIRPKARKSGRGGKRNGASVERYYVRRRRRRGLHGNLGVNRGGGFAKKIQAARGGQIVRRTA